MFNGVTPHFPNNPNKLQTNSKELQIKNMSAKQFTRIDGNMPIEGDVSKRAQVVSTLVGRGGSNLRRIRNKAGPGTYIRIYDSRRGRDARAQPIECDTIYIASKTKAALQKAIDLLRQDMGRGAERNAL